LAPSAAQAQVDLKVVSYEGLGDLVRANHGKVVLVDFWALTCKPCRRNFPHVVELYKKYKDKGLVVISAATDEIRDPKIQPRILKFLQDNEAIFTNVVVDEPTDVIVNKLRIYVLPCMYVFDREGKWRQLIGPTLPKDAEDEIDHVQLEAMIKKLLE